MPEKFEPQFFRPEGVPAPEAVPALEGTPFKSLQEVEQELRGKGVEKENIEAALALMKRMSFLDRKIFPENPAAFNFALKGDSLREFAGFVRPEKDEKERSYQITVEDLAKCLKEEKDGKVPIFGPERQLKLKRYLNDEQFLFSVAAHEVRHRVQHDYPVKEFSPEDAKLVDNQLLSNMIEFYRIEFKEREKIYRRENQSEEFIREKMSPREFDATIIEKLVANRLHKKPISTPEDLEEIVSTIKISALEKK